MAQALMGGADGPACARNLSASQECYLYAAHCLDRKLVSL